MGPRRKTKNQQARVGISKTRDGFGPVVPFQVSAALDFTYLAAMRNQSRTERARNDFVIERTKIWEESELLSECSGLNGEAFTKVYQRRSSANRSSGVAMIALHQGGQRIQKSFGAVQRIHVKLRFVFIPLVVRIKHHGRNALDMSFRADAAAFRNGHGISNHNSADMACAQDFKRSFHGRDWYDPVSGMRQNGIADGSQHPFSRDRKD